MATIFLIVIIIIIIMHTLSRHKGININELYLHTKVRGIILFVNCLVFDPGGKSCLILVGKEFDPEGKKFDPDGKKV